MSEELLKLKHKRALLKADLQSYENTIAPKKEALAKQIAELEAKFNEENKTTLHSKNLTEVEFDNADKELRRAIVAAWPGGDVSKTVADGLSVKVMPKLIYQEADAVKWAIEKSLPNLLKLNAVEFKKAAGVLKPEFVTVDSEVVAVIKD